MPAAVLAGGSGRLGSTSVTVPEPYWTASNVSPGRSTSTPAALPTGSFAVRAVLARGVEHPLRAGGVRRRCRRPR